jgi:multicopper oxidase
MTEIDRRQFTTLAAALPLTAPEMLRGAVNKEPTTSPPPATLQPLPAEADPWRMGSHPDFILSVAEQTVDVSGRPTPSYLVGGTRPGTPIRYRKGDTLRVRVENRLAEPTALHWHGLIVPNLQDGVPSITQAPIPPGMALYYEFILQQSGTYWYHSHFALQEQQGVSGSLIIDDPNEVHAYDEDVVVFLSDVTGMPVDDVIPGIRDGSVRVDVKDPYTPQDGAVFPIDVPYAAYLLNGRPPADPWVQIVRAGSRLRLRLINGSGSSFFRIKIDGLPLTVISADGFPIEPLDVDNLVIGTAQRYDVIVAIPESGSYTIHAAALGDDQQALGILHTPDVEPKGEQGRATFAGRALQPADLRAPFKTTLPLGPRKTFEVMLSGNMKRYVWMMNGHVWPEQFAESAGVDAQQTFYDVNAGDIVRFDFVNPTPMAHPMHLHGHIFRVLVDGKDSATAPIRDTVVVYPKSRLSIEFYANNPGAWFFHCHNVWHLATGMAQAVRYVV